VIPTLSTPILAVKKATNLSPTKSPSLTQINTKRNSERSST